MTEEKPGKPDLDGWKPIRPVEGDDGYARGLVEPTKVTEMRPCMLCRSFERPDLGKMIQHMVSKGCLLLPDGRIQSSRHRRCRECGATVAPAEAQTATTCASCSSTRLEGKPLVLDPRSYGFCRAEMNPTDLMATCEKWVQKRTRSEM